MDNLFNIFGIIFAISLLMIMAFPEHLIPEMKAKKRKVGSTYWGVYEGASPEEPESLKTIEIKEATAKEKVVAGSAMYAAGRGTSFRQ